MQKLSVVRNVLVSIVLVGTSAIKTGNDSLVHLKSPVLGISFRGYWCGIGQQQKDCKSLQQIQVPQIQIVPVIEPKIEYKRQSYSWFIGLFMGTSTPSKVFNYKPQTIRHMTPIKTLAQAWQDLLLERPKVTSHEMLLKSAEDFTKMQSEKILLETANTKLESEVSELKKQQADLLESKRTQFVQGVMKQGVAEAVLISNKEESERDLELYREKSKRDRSAFQELVKELYATKNAKEDIEQHFLKQRKKSKNLKNQNKSLKKNVEILEQSVHFFMSQSQDLRYQLNQQLLKNEKLKKQFKELKSIGFEIEETFSESSFGSNSLFKNPSRVALNQSSLVGSPDQKSVGSKIEKRPLADSFRSSAPGSPIKCSDHTPVTSTPEYSSRQPFNPVISPILSQDESLDDSEDENSSSDESLDDSEDENSSSDELSLKDDTFDVRYATGVNTTNPNFTFNDSFVPGMNNSSHS